MNLYHVTIEVEAEDQEEAMQLVEHATEGTGMEVVECEEVEE
jgi:hypothetical protein